MLALYHCATAYMLPMNRLLPSRGRRLDTAPVLDDGQIHEMLLHAQSAAQCGAARSGHGIMVMLRQATHICSMHARTIVQLARPLSRN